MRTAFMQAGLEDNPPVYILGGNIIPLGSSGLMTTTALRASNLTLLTAFPSAHSPPFERCGQGCAVPSTPSRLVTCGHMYLDQGQCFVMGVHAQTQNSHRGHLHDSHFAVMGLPVKGLQVQVWCYLSPKLSSSSACRPINTSNRCKPC